MKRRKISEDTILRIPKLYSVKRIYKIGVKQDEKILIKRRQETKKYLSRERAVEIIKKWLDNVLTVDVSVWDDEGNIKYFKSTTPEYQRQEIAYEVAKLDGEPTLL